MGLACHALRKMTQKISPHDSWFLFKVLTMAPLASFQTMWWHHHIVWRSHSSHDNIWTIWVHVVMTSCNYVISTMWWHHQPCDDITRAMWWHHSSYDNIWTIWVHVVMTSCNYVISTMWWHRQPCDDITIAIWWHHLSHDNIWIISIHVVMTSPEPCDDIISAMTTGPFDYISCYTMLTTRPLGLWLESAS